MSLEVDGRLGSVPIAYQKEEESWKYLDGQSTYENHFNAQNSYNVGGNAEGREPPQQRSKAKDLGQGPRLRLRLGFMFRWGFLFALVSVLAVVAAGVAGSIAAKRGKQFDTWYVTAFSSICHISPSLTVGAQYEHAAETQCNAECEGFV